MKYAADDGMVFATEEEARLHDKEVEEAAQRRELGKDSITVYDDNGVVQDTSWLRYKMIYSEVAYLYIKDNIKEAKEYLRYHFGIFISGDECGLYIVNARESDGTLDYTIERYQTWRRIVDTQIQTAERLIHSCEQG